MHETGRIGKADARLTDAKQRMKDTLLTLRHRLDPHRVAKDAVEGLVDQGAQALQAGVKTAKRNPLPLVGAVAFLAAFLNRKKLLGLIRRKPEPKSKKPAPAPRVRSTKTRRTSPKRISK